MVQRPDTKYVGVGDADVAYQVIGDGPNDVLYFYGIGSHVEVQWTMPGFDDFIERLLRFSRVIVFDRRGTGASDGIPRSAIPTCEEWTEDVLAVLDAAGSEQTAIIASIDAGQVALLFAAQHPERVSALILLNTTARYRRDDDPIGATHEELDVVVEILGTSWGTVDLARAINPDQADDIGALQEIALWSRYAATPRTFAAEYRYILETVDVRQALPLIQAPTRVLHVVESLFLSVAHGRYLAEHIPGATFVEIPGGSLGLIANLDVVADETADLLTGQRLPIEVDRILTTVLFTDIVGSTERRGCPRRSPLACAPRRSRPGRAPAARPLPRAGDQHDRGWVRHVVRRACAAAIQCATAILQATNALGIELRAGLHTGECEVRGNDLGGLAVHIAARVDACAAPGEILVSSVVRDLVVGSGIEFDERGSYDLKGVPGSWSLFAVRQRRA